MNKSFKKKRDFSSAEFRAKQISLKTALLYATVVKEYIVTMI